MHVPDRTATAMHLAQKTFDAIATIGWIVVR
jgi:hypothetical protein